MDKAWIEIGNKLTEIFSESREYFFLSKMLKKNVKDKTGKVLTNEENIMQRWKEYFKELIEEDESEVSYIGEQSEQ